MSKFAQFLNRISNWKTLVGLILLYMLFAGVLLNQAEKKINQLAGKDIGVVDLTIGFNPKKTLQMIADYGDMGRSYYKKAELTLDLVYPLIYSFLFAVIITLIYRRLLSGPVSYLNILPFIALGFDYLENITIVSLLSHYPEQSMIMAILCEVFKLLKFLMFALILFLILFGLVKLLTKRQRKA